MSKLVVMLQVMVIMVVDVMDVYVVVRWND